MICLGKGFCVFLGVGGSFYCTWLLWDCWQQAGFCKRPATPSLPSGDRDSKSTRTEWFCQLVLAVAAIWLAVTLVMASGDDMFSPLWQSKTDKQQLSRQAESTFSKADFGVHFDYDTSRISRPITGIDCAHVQVSDEQVTYLLQKAPELEWLNLSGTPITGDVLGELKHTPSLRGLVLACPQITDGELVHLKGLTSLYVANLTDTQVTDKGLLHLEGMTNLHELRLTNTQVTDEGLVHLKNLTNLRKLYLVHTQVTDEGARILQQALPSCRINR